MNESQDLSLAMNERSLALQEGLSSSNEDKLYLALSSAGMGTWDWHPVVFSMHLDERMHALFGLAPSTFGGRYEQFLEMIHPEDRQQVATEFAQAVERRTEYDGEFRVV